MTNIVIYIVVVIETFIFVNSFGTKQSFTLLYMLLLAPIIDFLLFKYMKKNLVVMCDDVGENIEKNTEIDYSIIIRNNGLLPIAYLQYELLYNRKLYTEEGRNIRERISVKARDEERDVYSFTTIHRGLATIALTNIKMKSILGLFTANLTTYEKRTNINIIPNLVQVEGLDEFLQSVSLGEAEDDDVSKNSFSGEPSYDFKEYSEGDPLNRVNWKLSSKRNILMIRKSAEEKRLEKSIILDPAILERGDYETRGDRLIEAIIGLANDFFNLDYGVEVIYCDDRRRWNKFVFEGEDTVTRMQLFFSTYNFVNISKFNNRFANFNSDVNADGDYIICTNYKDNDLANFSRRLEANVNSVSIISDNRKTIIDNEYYLNGDYSIERI